MAEEVETDSRSSLQALAGRLPVTGMLTAAFLAMTPFSGFLYRNRDEASLGDLWLYCSVYASAVLVVILGIALIFGKRIGSRWSFLLGWCALALFWYRDMKSFGDGAFRTEVLPAQGSVTWVAVILVVAVLIYRLCGRPWFSTAALSFAVTIFALPLSLYALYTNSVEEVPSWPVQPVATSTTTLEKQPDIYFLMLDGLGRQDILDVFFDIDIGKFTEGLRKSGFVVADRALGAHPMTLLEFPAILDQSYQVQPGDPGPPETYERQMAIIAGANKTQEILHGNGYHFISVESDNLICNPSPIKYLETCLGKSLESRRFINIREKLAFMTPLLEVEYRRLIPDAVSAWLLGTDQWWNEANVGGKGFLASDIIDAVEAFRAENSSEPLFVIAHMRHTHPPFTLKADCTYRDRGFRGTLGDWDDVTGYRYAIDCATKQVTALIDQIDPSAVVVLQSDHGPVEGEHDSLDTSVGDLDAPKVPIEKLLARAAVFSAVRLPSPCRPFVSDTYAGVTTFKVVLECLAGDLQHPEPERTYWTWYWDSEVLDATDHLRGYEDSLSRLN